MSRREEGPAPGALRVAQVGEGGPGKRAGIDPQGLGTVAVYYATQECVSVLTAGRAAPAVT